MRRVQVTRGHARHEHGDDDEMICTPCCTGQHGKCRWPQTCPCQHKTVKRP